jgi:hypothetical protein
MPRVMPFGWLLLMAIFEQAGMNPAAYHFFNLGVHLLNAVMLYGLANLLFRLAGNYRGELISAGWRCFLTLAITAAWTLHPLRSESIAWATGWLYPSTTFFALLAALMMLSRLESKGWRRWLLWVGAVLAFLCSALVYPLSLGLPMALLGVEWWLVGAKEAKGSQKINWMVWKKLAIDHLVFWLIAGLVLAVNVWARVVKNEFYPPAPVIQSFTLENRVVQAGRSVIYYAVRVAWPGETTPVYDLRDPERIVSSAGAGIMVALASWMGWVWWRRKKAPGGLVWTLAFLGVTAPFSGFLDYPFQTSDRYGYFPGLVLTLGVFLALRMVSGCLRVPLIVVITAWLAWQATAIPRQLPKWENTEALFAYVTTTLKSPEGRLGYAITTAMHRARTGDIAGARQRLDEVRATGLTSESLTDAEAEINRFEVYGKIPTIIQSRRAVIASDAILSYKLALDDIRSGQLTGGRFRYLQTLDIDPDFNDARYNFALWLATQGKVGEALLHYDELTRRAVGGFKGEREKRLLELIHGAARATGQIEYMQSVERKINLLSGGAVE